MSVVLSKLKSLKFIEHNDINDSKLEIKKIESTKVDKENVSDFYNYRLLYKYPDTSIGELIVMSPQLAIKYFSYFKEVDKNTIIHIKPTDSFINFLKTVNSHITEVLKKDDYDKFIINNNISKMLESNDITFKFKHNVSKNIYIHMTKKNGGEVKLINSENNLDLKEQLEKNFNSLYKYKKTLKDDDKFNVIMKCIFKVKITVDMKFKAFYVYLSPIDIELKYALDGGLFLLDTKTVSTKVEVKSAPLVL